MKSQAVSQVNNCGNKFMPENVWCQNTASQIQGDDNHARLASSQGPHEDDHGNGGGSGGGAIVRLQARLVILQLSTIT